MSVSKTTDRSILPFFKQRERLSLLLENAIVSKDKITRPRVHRDCYGIRGGA